PRVVVPKPERLAVALDTCARAARELARRGARAPRGRAQPGAQDWTAPRDWRSAARQRAAVHGGSTDLTAYAGDERARGLSVASRAGVRADGPRRRASPCQPAERRPAAACPRARPRC